MLTRPPWSEPPRRRARLWRRDRMRFAASFAGMVAVGSAATQWPAIRAFLDGAASMWPLLGLAVAVALVIRFRYFAWHLFANTVAVEKPSPLGKVWVVDGDTVDDLSAGVRYRLANIDAPETGENAKCYKERQRGEQAKWEVVHLVRTAKSVAVRRTWRIDRYGRRIAFVEIDGLDLGRMLVARGLARPWRGRREPWCGKRGGLAKIAAGGAMPFSCRTCRDWRKRS